MRIGGEGADRASVSQRCREVEINLRLLPEGDWGITLDETADSEDLRKIVFALSGEWVDLHLSFRGKQVNCIPDDHQRQTSFLDHPVFHAHRSETQMVRYIHKLQGRDLSLTHSMIPLGSCTMKLNATVEMMPITWSAFADLHPFVPLDQAGGYTRMCRELVEMLKSSHGLCRRIPTAQRWISGRICGSARYWCLSQRAGRGAANYPPNSLICTRNQPGERRHGGHAGRGGL